MFPTDSPYPHGPAERRATTPWPSHGPTIRLARRSAEHAEFAADGLPLVEVTFNVTRQQWLLPYQGGADPARPRTTELLFDEFAEVGARLQWDALHLSPELFARLYPRFVPVSARKLDDGEYVAERAGVPVAYLVRDADTQRWHTLTHDRNRVSGGWIFAEAAMEHVIGNVLLYLADPRIPQVPEEITAAVTAQGHVVKWHAAPHGDPAQRWSCEHCGMPVYLFGTTVFGRATVRPCPGPDPEPDTGQGGV